MPRGKDTFSIQTNLPVAMRPRLEALAAHREQSLSAAVGDAVRDAILRYEQADTKDAKLDRSLVMLSDILNKLGMLQVEKWTQVAAPDGKIYVNIKLDDGDLERLQRSIFAHGLGK